MARAEWLGAIAAALMLNGATPVTAQTTLSANACSDPQLECGGLIRRECVETLGAGVVAAEASTDCGAQMSQYRECLAAIVETCSVVQQDGGGATEAERFSFEELASLGGLIADPKTLVEYYNNALVYNRRGDALSARRMYEKAIVEGARAIDIHRDYVSLLKAQEGLVGAREIYADLARRQAENPTARMIHATLLPDTRREPALRELTSTEPPYAPAWFEIARLYSIDRLGDQSLADKREEKAALEAFVAADEAGGVYKWFLQKDEAEIWRDEASRRLAAYTNRNVDFAPVTMSATPSNDSWTVALYVAEAAREIRYSIDGGAVVSTGFTEIIDQRTGSPAPRNFLTLPLSVSDAKIRVWYDDVRGQEQGPFELSFDAQEAHTAFARNIMSNLTQQWVEGRDFDGKFLVYFTSLLSFRCGLSEIAYGVERDAPDQVFEHPPCNMRDPYSVDTDAPIYLTFEQRPERMVVQLTYADGEKSAPREFRF